MVNSHRNNHAIAEEEMKTFDNPNAFIAYLNKLGLAYIKIGIGTTTTSRGRTGIYHIVAIAYCDSEILAQYENPTPERIDRDLGEKINPQEIRRDLVSLFEEIACKNHRTTLFDFPIKYLDSLHP